MQHVSDCPSVAPASKGAPGREDMSSLFILTCPDAAAAAFLAAASFSNTASILQQEKGGIKLRCCGSSHAAERSAG